MPNENVRSISDAELAAEVERRRKAKEAKERPQLVEKPDFSAVIKITEEYLSLLATDGSQDNDDDHYIYEEVMKALYGPKVFDWINKKL